MLSNELAIVSVYQSKLPYCFWPQSLSHNFLKFLPVIQTDFYSLFALPAENRRPRDATRQNSSMFKYLTRFTDSGRYRNQLVNPPPSAARPSYGGTEEDSMEKSRGDRQELTTEYSQMPSTMPTYEVPVERQGAYENVQPTGLSVPKLTVGDLA